MQFFEQKFPASKESNKSLENFVEMNNKTINNKYSYFLNVCT